MVSDKCNDKEKPTKAMGTSRRLSQKHLGLPPVVPDGGYGWVIVMASFIVIFLLMGFGYSLGVYLVQFVEEFQASRASISWIMAFHNGIAYLLGPVLGAISAKIGYRASTIIGSLFVAIALFAAPFCSSIISLVFVFGIMGGLGLGLVYLSSLVILSHYFDSRLSLANGIASSALGISSLVYPVLIDFLIKTYGWRGSLWIISGIVLHCVVFGALFRPFTAKDRKVLQEQWQKSQYKTDNKLDVCEKDDKEPITKKDENTEGISVFILIKKSVCLLSKPVFLVFAISYFFAYSCFLIPSTYIPDHAIAMGIDHTRAAILLSIIGAMNAVFKWIFGWLADRSWCDPVIMYSVCLLVAGLATISFPFLNSYPLLCCYSMIMGIYTGNAGISCQIIAADLVGLNRLSESLGLLLCLGGAMTFLGIPFAGFLYDISGSYAYSFYTFGTLVTVGGVITLPLRHFARCISRKPSNDQSAENENIILKPS